MIATILSGLFWLVVGIVGIIIGVLVLFQLLKFVWAIISDVAGLITAFIVFAVITGLVLLIL